MDFCFAIASEEILKSIEEGKDKNIVISPASMTLVLNLIASGSTGGTLNQLLAHLKSNDVSAITKNSSLIMKLFLPPPPPPSSSTSSQESSSNITQQSQSLDPVNPSNGGFNQLTPRNHKRNYVSGADRDKPKHHPYGSKGKGPDLCCFNGVYVDEKVHLRSTYKGLAEGVYNAVVKSVDFAYKERNTGRMIGVGHESRGLYYLAPPPSPLACIASYSKLYLPRSFSSAGRGLHVLILLGLLLNAYLKACSSFNKLWVIQPICLEFICSLSLLINLPLQAAHA